MVAGTLHPVLLTPTGTAPKGADYMLAHELTHHMESRAGTHALDDKDAEELAEFRREVGED